jgi:hypothetical protein
MPLADGRQAAAAGHRRRAGCRLPAGVTEHANTPRQRRILESVPLGETDYRRLDWTGVRGRSRSARVRAGSGWRAAGVADGSTSSSSSRNSSSADPSAAAEQTPGSRGEPVARQPTSAWTLEPTTSRVTCRQAAITTPMSSAACPIRACAGRNAAHTGASTLSSAADAGSAAPARGWARSWMTRSGPHPGPIAEGAVEEPPALGKPQVAVNETRSSTSGRSMPVPLPAGKIARCSSTRRPGSRGPVAGRVVTRTVSGILHRGSSKAMTHRRSRRSRIRRNSTVPCLRQVILERGRRKAYSTPGSARVPGVRQTWRLDREHGPDWRTTVGWPRRRRALPAPE